MNEEYETVAHPVAAATTTSTGSGAASTTDTSSSVIPAAWTGQRISSTRRWLNLSASRPSTGLTTACEISIAAATAPALVSDPVTAEMRSRQLIDRIPI